MKIFQISAALILCGFLAVHAAAQYDSQSRERELAESNRRAAQPTVGPIPRMRPTLGLDKESRERLERLRSVDREVRTKYAEFLKGSNTGIFKLFPDNGCVEKNLIRIDGDCTGFVPDSNYFLFRTGKYNGYNHDIGLYKDNFVSNSFFTQAIFVSLADERLETVYETHQAIKLLEEFQPSVSPAAVTSSVARISVGYKAGDYFFSSRVPFAVNTTYAIRKIEFKAGGDWDSVRSQPGKRLGILSLRSLGLQERKDSIFVFRVISEGGDGEITILWKQISRKDAPTIKFRKGDEFPVFSSAVDK